MKKQSALDRGYCKHCASFHPVAGWNCGTGLGLKNTTDCRMDDATRKRFRAEWGIDGEMQTSVYQRGAFGDRELQKAKRKRRVKK